MKRLIYIIPLLLTGLFFYACQDELPELGEKPSAASLNYQITQNPEDPNMVILESQTPDVIPLWSHPMGRSTKVRDTVRLAFPGDYKFVYSVQSSAGLVSADTFDLEISTTNLSYVDDPLWDNLTGGVGESKTWLLDLDENGVSKYFDGPMYFYGTDNGWQGECTVEEGDCWSWPAGYSDNPWLMPTGDYGEMTFSLEGGAYFYAEKPMEGGIEQEGTFFLDADAKTLSITDASILRGYKANNAGIAGVSDWSNYNVISLTENTMQLGVIRDQDIDGEGLAQLVYNFISKEYADDWVPEDLPEPEPELPDGWFEDVTTIVTTEKKWELSPETPFNYAGLDGALLYGWNSSEEYPDSTEFNSTVSSSYANFLLTLNSENNSAVYTDPNGGETEGMYTLDQDGYFTFEGINPEFDITSSVSLFTSEDNQWRLLKLEKNEVGLVTDMWVGVRLPDSDEYIAYHLVLQQGEEDPMVAWIDALAGKTFVPDVNWFVDWVSSPPAFSGGWTSAETFGDDYTTNSWVWTEDVRNIAESASLEFFMEGEQMKVTVSQTLTTEHNEGTDESPNWVTDEVNESYSVTGNVNIDPETNVLTIDVPLIDYAGSPARWLSSTGNEGGEWFFVSHGGSNLGNIDTEGMWLGYSSSDTETTIFHFLVQ